ncbi:phage integrase Arm DNA-binding domain-containing protein, partial [Escherichia coli]|uniref:phage integrase Arm DNA-binding domain-containing protein n=1 Tax=Escherichia coli TaxID=562 RepID=UPI003F8B7DCE
MGRRRSHERRDLPPNLYIRNNGYYCYRDPRTGKEFGLGRDRRIAITEAIQWICPYISRHLLSLNTLQARCRRYSRG